MIAASYVVMSMVSVIAKENCSNLEDTAIKCCFKLPDISSIHSTIVFLVNEMALNKCIFSEHTVITQIIRNNKI